MDARSAIAMSPPPADTGSDASTTPAEVLADTGASPPENGERPQMEFRLTADRRRILVMVPPQPEPERVP